MKPRHILIILIVLAFLFVSFGCKNQQLNNTKTEKKITLQCALIGGGDYENIYENISKFEQETGINVEIIYKNNHFELDKKLKMDFEADTDNYDVISNHSSFFSQYVEYLEPLDEYFSYEDLKDYLPRLLTAGNKDGNLYIIPRHADISCLHYRTDLFEDPQIKQMFFKQYKRQLTVPETWDEFYEVAMFFGKFEGLYGTQFAGKEEALTGRFYEILLSNGGEFIDENGNAAFNSRAGVKTIQMLKDLYQAGAMPEDMLNYLWDDLAKNWKNGKIAIATEWYSYYSYFQNEETSQIAGKFDFARQPVGDAGIHSGWIGIHGFSIPRNSENKEEAAQLIKFLTNEDNAYLEGIIGYLPVRSSVWDKLINEAKYSPDPLAKKRLELAKTQFSEDSFTPPLVAEWIPASNILFPTLQKIILGELDPKEGLNLAAKQVDDLLLNSF